MFRLFLIILSGSMLGSLLGLVRSIVVAHQISVTDFGIASTFALALSVVEMISALGLQQQIVQHEDGDDPNYQAALQALHATRALFSGALLLVLADPIAAFFNIPDVAWAFRLMAIVPVLNGLTHMDQDRMKRRMRYVPSIQIAVLSMLISLAMVWPLTWVVDDYRVMLYAALGQNVSMMVISHIVAERPYRWVFSRKIVMGSVRFGWPILLNAILLFVVFNGERVIVGRELGVAALAVFSMAFTLVLTPTLVMEGSANSFFLPQLAAAREDREKFVHLSLTVLQCHLLFAALIVIGVALLGAPVIHLLLGPKYAAAIPILTWLALMQGVRAAKGGSSAPTIASGFSNNGLVASLMRAALLPIAWYVVAQGGELLHVIWLGILGEACGYVAGLLLAKRQLHLPLHPLLPMLVATVAIGIIGALHAQGQSSPTLPHLSPVATGTALVALLGLVLLLGKDLRLYVQRRIVTVREG
jgi:O-antigen/teichoic acid export membrane protein